MSKKLNMDRGKGWEKMGQQTDSLPLKDLNGVFFWPEHGDPKESHAFSVCCVYYWLPLTLAQLSLLLSTFQEAPFVVESRWLVLPWPDHGW